MSSSAPQSVWVATIVAGRGSKLSQELLGQLATAANAVHAEWLSPGIAADLFSEGGDAASLCGKLKKLIATHPYDVIVQSKNRRAKKFLIADMESTIIEEEMLDELADVIGLRDQVASITRRAMNGELDFVAALRERVALLRGQPVSILGEIAQRISYTSGAAELVKTMKARGAQCWLVSGGFKCFVEPVAKQLGFDRFYANDLVIEDGKIVGVVNEPILDKNNKQAFLEQACGELKLSMDETMAVGDGANDVPMLKTCASGGGLGVAYEAKPNVRGVIPQQINYSDLKTLLYAQGYKETSFRTS
jgi:phosphoserine phosphatase